MTHRASAGRRSMKLKLALLAGAAPAAALYGAPRPVQIIPSVLPADFAALGLDCTALEKAGCDRIQFDVMDGNFVPNLTFGPDVIAAQRKTTKLMFETQLMVSERCTDAMLPQFTECTKGPNGEPGVVIVHAEACTHLHRSLSNIRAMGGSPSVALNPSTPPEAVEHVLDLVDHVLVMTVNPGFGGQAYIPTMTDKRGGGVAEGRGGGAGGRHGADATSPRRRRVAPTRPRRGADAWRRRVLS